jgi:integrase
VKPPRAGRLEITDTRTTGLQFRITAAGVRKWSFRFRDPTRGGKPGRATIGTYPELSLRQARDQAGDMRRVVEAGGNPAASRKAARAGAGSFGALAERFMVEHSRRHKRSHAADDRNLRKHVLPLWKDRAAASIKRKDVIALVEGLVTAGKPTLANRVQALLSSIFTFAIDADELEANPCHRLRRRGLERAGSRVLSDDEIQLFWHGITAPRRRFGLGLRLALLTAARESEIAGMARAELEHLGEPSRAAWIIPGERTKNKREHVIPLSPLALETVLQLLEMLEPGQQHLFPTQHKRGGPLSGSSLWWGMDQFGESLTGNTIAERTWNVDRPSPHDLRRTVETRMARLRIPKEYRDKCLNHAAGDVGSRHYDRHDYFDEKADAFNRWAALVMGLVEGSSGAAVVSISDARKERRS